MNSIRRSLKAQQLLDKKENNVERVFNWGNDEYQDIPVEECYKYVTLLKEDEPDLRFYVIREGANAKEKGLEPVSEKEILKMAETIAGSVRRRAAK